jgi:putative restriction endonuclease
MMNVPYSSQPMANAVFTTKAEPVYDDLPELRYHFPKTYLNQVRLTVGDFIVYYEPRREGAALSGRAGRQCYFATARVDDIADDPQREGYYYALMSNYLEFTHPVPFRIDGNYPERSLRKTDGSTNKGRFGRAVRIIDSEDYDLICRRGFPEASAEENNTVREPAAEGDRSYRTRIQQVQFRERAFTDSIRSAYNSTCAFTGLRLECTNRKGNQDYEVHAAHIKPVAKMGPDSPRNGIALSRTIHWMFDSGIFSIADNGQLLMATKLVPENIRKLLHADGFAKFPADLLSKPHPLFLKHHREHIYIGS